MKILFCSHVPQSRTLGASKLLIEVAEEMEPLGWQTSFLTPNELLGPNWRNANNLDELFRIFSQALRNYLKENAGNYDVIDYDQSHLPYSRSEFPSSTLMVARSVLLYRHFNLEIIKKITQPKANWKSKTKFFLKHSLGFDKSHEIIWSQRIKDADLTFSQADLINVANTYDKDELVNSGLPENKIQVFPYGINRARRILFNKVDSKIPTSPKVAFVGTFDYRKGASDFPKIFENILVDNPNIIFKLIGTKGLYKSSEEVLSFFSQKIRKQIEIISTFEPNDLPNILSDCSVGLFPSYVEGFGIGVLEMLASSVPVIAYDAPGPPMMLSPEYLVAPGDTDNMSQKILDLLNDPQKLTAARIWAKERSQQFCWKKIAESTSRIYLENWHNLQKK
jgi:glycosyltransferase involved in cell wall biosynthesis